jgi:1-acyl-sn-glycerol-3-phosphate acyltransferase
MKQREKKSMTPWYHSLGWMVMRPYALFLCFWFRVRAVHRDPLPQPPYLIMANHASLLDAYILMRFMPPTAYVANQQGLASPVRIFVSFVMQLLRKQKGKASLSVIDQIHRLIQRGERVCIFPEGDRNWDGKTGTIQFSAAKLARLFTLPVYFAKMSGTYCSFPRWARTRRRGAIEIEFSCLDKKDVESMSREQIHQEIIRRLQHSECKSPIVQKTAWKGKHLAENIEYLLWLCPQCETHDSLRGEGSRIRCTQCGAEWEIDGTMRVAPGGNGIEDIEDWNGWQKQKIAQWCRSPSPDRPLTRSSPVRLLRCDRHPYRDYGDGALELFGGHVKFIPAAAAAGDHSFDIPHIHYYADNFNRFFRFEYHTVEYRIRFGPKNASKWIFFLRYLQEKEKIRQKQSNSFK